MENLLQIQDLTLLLYLPGHAQALNGVSLAIHKAESLGLVGESGCGKSVTAKSIVGLLDSPGKIEAGRDLFRGNGSPDAFDIGG